ncbi:1-deoxy-D-xylulose-5-phosphate synthase [Chromobacterium violaceum]|uniref:1-deoxy-D-xylulose-5-phosphate synthase n=1 Tax=Chromobacterium violaceum TaxID=536 RepID=A0A3S4HNB4_CHRVL|nr:1-deoxy-D-xylulose-5-phosphate synthase [Chromobacterium violaceum]
MTVMAPSDENECRQLLYTAFQLDTPTAVRYPRGTGPGAEIQPQMAALPSARAWSAAGQAGRHPGFRQHGASALAAAEALDATVADMRFVKRWTPS